MGIVWDEPKRLANIRKHHVVFAMVGFEFLENVFVERARDGRFEAIGLLEGRVVAIIFAPLGTEAISLISVRLASAYERERIIDG